MDHDAVRHPARPRRHNRRFLRGFTLVELTIVVLIIGVVSAIVLSRFRGTLARHRVEAAANRIVNDVNLACRYARIGSTEYKVTFNVANDSYRLPQFADPDHPTERYDIALDDEPYKVRIVSADFDGDAEIKFNGYGMPDSGGTVVLQAAGYQVTVEVDPDTGHAYRKAYE